MADASIEGDLTVALSGTALEGEYDRICRAMTRCATSEHRFEPERYAPSAIERVRAAWLARMEFEHRSSMIFSQLAAQLVEANATLDAKVCMLRMAQDELRHTETCANVVRALGGEARCRTTLSVAPLARHLGCGAEERALRNVIYTTCLSEMNAVSQFVSVLDSVEDAFLREANRLLLSDEILHGQFGFFYLEAWQPWLEGRPDVVASVHGYLRRAFAVLESALVAPSTIELTDDERALGQVDGSQANEVFYGTLTDAVLPALDRFGFDATTAWAQRYR